MVRPRMTRRDLSLPLLHRSARRSNNAAYERDIDGNGKVFLSHSSTGLRC